MAKALVIRGGAIGDFILTMPALRLLRDSLPELEIEVLGYKPVVDLAIKAGVADRVRSFEHGLYAPLFVPGADIWPELENWLDGFQLIISYLHDQDGIFSANLKRFTRATLVEGPARVDPAASCHAAQQLAKPLEQLAMWLEDHSAPIHPAPAGNLASRQRVALHPGSGGLHKCWPLARWAKLASRLGREAGNLVWITGEAEDEHGVTAHLKKLFPDPAAEHWNNLPLTELSDRLSAGCSVYIGHDSGISHLANACGIEGRVLFGPTDPRVWSPWRGSFKIIRAPGGDLEQLPVDTVLESLRPLISK